MTDFEKFFEIIKNSEVKVKTCSYDKGTIVLKIYKQYDDTEVNFEFDEEGNFVDFWMIT